MVRWEYAVLRVRISAMSTEEWNYEAIAWVDKREIYKCTLNNYYWTAPLADLGRDGWELVSTTTENALMTSEVIGWPARTSRPVATYFTFKRPLA